MTDKKYNIYWGAAGAGKAYSKHTSILPDYYVDNDEEKWGHQLNGKDIKPPNFLTPDIISQVSQITITTGWVESVQNQLLSMNVPSEIIKIPAKSLLGSHPFTIKKNKVQSARFLDLLMNFDPKIHIVAGGGTALGFFRDSDFIEWDFDFDLFASLKCKEALSDLLRKLGCYYYIEDSTDIEGTVEIKGEVRLSFDDVIPFAIKFFDPDDKTYRDVYDNHSWEWPSTMFSEPLTVEVHGYNLKVPNPPQLYVEGVYGKSWKKPNPEFSHDDYGKA